MTNGKSHVPHEKLGFTFKIIAPLRRFPIGTVSIIGPGSEHNWGYKAGDYTHLAETYFQEYVDSGHPVYNPEHVYDKMEPNFTSSLVREKRGPGDTRKKMPTQKSRWH